MTAPIFLDKPTVFSDKIGTTICQKNQNAEKALRKKSLPMVGEKVQ